MTFKIASKMMDIKEFRSLGYLQEVNRRFFHPLGLSLEVGVDMNGEYQINGVRDERDDPEGTVFGFKDEPYDEILNDLGCKEYVDREWEKRSKIREEKLGFTIEPIDPEGVFEE